MEDLPPGFVAAEELPAGFTAAPDKTASDLRQTPFVQRATAAMDAVRKGNVKDTLGNVGAAAFELGKPEADILSTIGMGSAGKSAVQALLKGSVRPALGMAAGLGTTAATEEGMRRSGVSPWISGPVGTAAGMAVGGSIAPEALDTIRGGVGGLLKRMINGPETPEWSPMRPKSGLVTPLGGAAPVEYGNLPGPRVTPRTIQTESPEAAPTDFRLKVKPGLVTPLGGSAPVPYGNLPGPRATPRALQTEAPDLPTEPYRPTVKPGLVTKLGGSPPTEYGNLSGTAVKRLLAKAAQAEASTTATAPTPVVDVPTELETQLAASIAKARATKLKRKSQ